MQERRNSIANALELRLSCTNPSIYDSMSDLAIQKKVGIIFTDTVKLALYSLTLLNSLLRFILHIYDILISTHCGLVMPYGDKDLDQYWLR